MKEAPPEAIFFDLVQARSSAQDMANHRRLRLIKLGLRAQARDIIRKAKPVTAFEAEVAQKDAELEARRDEYQALLADRQGKLNRLRKGLPRGFLTQDEFAPLEQQVTAFADLQNQAPVLRPPEAIEAPAEKRPAPDVAAQPDTIIVEVLDAGSVGTEPRRPNPRDVAERGKSTESARKAPTLVDFQFPGEAKPVKIDRVTASFLEQLRPFTANDEPPHLVSRRQLEEGAPKGTNDGRIRATIGSTARVLEDRKYRLGRVVVDSNYRNDRFYAEAETEPLAHATIIGEHLIIPGTVQYELFPAEYNLLYKLQSGLAPELVQGEEITQLTSILESATGISNSIELRTAANGEQFYDLRAIDIERNESYVPATPKQLQVIEAFITGAPVDEIKQDLTDGQGALPALRELSRITINLLNRGNIGITKADAEEGALSESDIHNHLVNHMHEQGINAIQLLENIERTFDIPHDSNRIRAYSKRLDPNPAKRRTILDNAPLPQAEPTESDAGVTAGDIVDEAEERARAKYTPAFLERTADVLLTGLLAIPRFHLEGNWSVSEIVNTMPDGKLTKEILDEMIESGIVTPLSTSQGNNGPVYWLDTIGITEAAMHLQLADLPWDMHDQVARAVQASYKKKYETARGTYGRTGGRRRVV